MSIPGRGEAAALLFSLDPPAWHLRHSRAVAEVAGWLAARCESRGIRVDRRLVEAASLLHDIDKLLPEDGHQRQLPHGEGAARWLAGRGCGELAAAVASHPVTRLADDAWYARWSETASLEERLVAYADKRAGQRLEPMEARFASWQRRYPPADGERHPAGWSRLTIDRVRVRAAALETGVCSDAGVRPETVRRLRWTAGALRRARATTEAAS